MNTTNLPHRRKMMRKHREFQHRKENQRQYLTTGNTNVQKASSERWLRQVVWQLSDRSFVVSILSSFLTFILRCSVRVEGWIFNSRSQRARARGAIESSPLLFFCRLTLDAHSLLYNSLKCLGKSIASELYHLFLPFFFISFNAYVHFWVVLRICGYF